MVGMGKSCINCIVDIFVDTLMLTDLFYKGSGRDNIPRDSAVET